MNLKLGMKLVGLFLLAFLFYYDADPYALLSIDVEIKGLFLDF